MGHGDTLNRIRWLYAICYNEEHMENNRANRLLLRSSYNMHVMIMYDMKNDIFHLLPQGYAYQDEAGKHTPTHEGRRSTPGFKTSF